MIDARKALFALLVLAAGCGVPRQAPPPGAHGPSGPLQTKTAYITQEVDGAAQARTHRDGLRVLLREVEALVIAETPGDLHFRVPEARLDEVVARLPDLAEVVRSEVRAPEVSGAVRDLRVRVQSATALRDRLVALLERASTVEEVLAVERELGRVTESLALMQSQLQAQESEVAFAEVHLRVEDPASPGPLGWVFYGLYRGVKWLFVWD